MLEDTENLSGDRIVAPSWFDQGRFDALTVVPEGRGNDLRNALLQQALAATFQLKMHREMRPVSVYVLRAASGIASKMIVSNAKPTRVLDPGHFTGVATPMSGLIRGLGHELNGVEIADETGLAGAYDFDLAWQKGNFESLQAALHDQLGLTLEKETRDRDFLVVAAAVEPKTW